MRHVAHATLVLLVTLSATVGGCGDDDDEDGGSGGTGSPDNTGKVCDAPDDCYPDVADGELLGTAMCLDRVRGGYCTHTCTADTDCCAAEGECKTQLKQVCAPFESSTDKMCFLSCEDADRGGLGEQEYCQKEASTDFICRASGGGDPRKVCVPGDCGYGESCGADADCETGLTCLTEFTSGYCGKKGCTTNAECSADSLCIKQGDNNYCLKKCAGESDCSFCRHPDHAAACRADVTYVEAGSTGTVCVPPT